MIFYCANEEMVTTDSQLRPCSLDHCPQVVRWVSAITDNIRRLRLVERSAEISQPKASSTGNRLRDVQVSPSLFTSTIGHLTRTYA